MSYRVSFGSKGKNKFNAQSQNYGGKWYASKLEASQAMELDWRLKAGEITEWSRQVKIDIRVKGLHITNYYIDFVATRKKDGVKEYIEVKGLEMDLWQIKWRLLNALKDELLEPGAELIVKKH